MTVHELSKRNLLVTSIIVWLIITFLVFNNIGNFIDSMNLFLPPADFYIDEAVLKISPLTIETNNAQVGSLNIDTENPTIDELIKEKISKMPNYYDPEALLLYQFMNKYKQGIRYNFNFVPDEIIDIDLNYKTTMRLNGWEVYSENTHKYAFSIKNNILFLTKFPANAEIPKSGTALKGVLVPSNEQTIDDLKTIFSEYANINNYYPYEFDTTNLFSGEKTSGFIFFTISLIIAGFLMIFVIRQYFNKNARALYKKIDLLNGDEKIIDEQLKTCVEDGKCLIMQDWIIRNGKFRVTITRNIKKEQY